MIEMPFLVLVLLALATGGLGALVVSRGPFHALASGGTPGFAAAVAAGTVRRRNAVREWIAACRHRTTVAYLAACAALGVFVLGWLLLGVLAFLVRRNDVVVRFDARIARWGHVHASGLSDRALEIITWLGVSYVVAGLAALLAAVEWLRFRNGRVVVFLAAVVVGNGLITLAVKALTDRARPALNPVAHTLGPSFPSGHTSMAAAFFAAAALLLSRGGGRTRTAALGGAAVAVAVAVAASRVFLDVHWVSDVVAGLALGWAWFAFCAIALGGPPRTSHREKTAKVPDLAGT